MKIAPLKIASMMLVLLAVSGMGRAQAKLHKPQVLTGCVAHLPSTADKLVLAVDDRCMLLAGPYEAARIADHRITVRGVVTEAEGMTPLTLTVQRVTGVQAACSKTCTLEPPGTRGVHGKERPGAEGGTRGLHLPAESPQP